MEKSFSQIIDYVYLTITSVLANIRHDIAYLFISYV